jgi:hypothetical protein
VRTISFDTVPEVVLVISSLDDVGGVVGAVGVATITLPAAKAELVTLQVNGTTEPHKLALKGVFGLSSTPETEYTLIS